MIYRFQYTTPEERDELIVFHSDKYYIGEDNLIDGRFINFSDNLSIDRPIPIIQISEAEYQRTNDRIELLELAFNELIMGGM